MVSAMTIVGTHFGRTATIGIDARHGGSFDFGQQNLATGSQFEVMRATILAAGHTLSTSATLPLPTWRALMR